VTSVLMMYYPRLLLPLDLQNSENCTEVTLESIDFVWQPCHAYQG